MQNLMVDNAVPFKHRHGLERHFVRHGDQFNAKTADEYERLADDFMAKTKQRPSLHSAYPRDEDFQQIKLHLRVLGLIREVRNESENSKLN